MDSDFSAVLYGAGPGGARVSPDSAAALLKAESLRLNGIFSDYDPGSELSRLQGRAGDTLRASPELHAVLIRANEMQTRSGGVFDIGLKALKKAYGLGSGETPKVPDSAEVRAAMAGNPLYASAKGSRASEGSAASRGAASSEGSALGGPTDTGGPAGSREAAAEKIPGPASMPAGPPPPVEPLRDGRIVLRRDSLLLDLGGIAKGYAVDRMHRLLDSLGYPVHLVQAGGDMRAAGNKPEGWRLGVRHPLHRDTICALVESQAPMAVSTSGNYERYFDRDGRRYHHLLDPRTGRPVPVTASVTVVARESMVADALATALFVLGPDKGRALAEKYGAAVLWVHEKDGRLCGLSVNRPPARFRLWGLPACTEPPEADFPGRPGKERP